MNEENNRHKIKLEPELSISDYAIGDSFEAPVPDESVFGGQQIKLESEELNIIDSDYPFEDPGTDFNPDLIITDSRLKRFLNKLDQLITDNDQREAIAKGGPKILYNDPKMKPKQFLCEHCNYTSKTKSNLKNHVLIQHIRKQNTCKVCGREFQRAQNLKTHMLVHQNDNIVCCLIDRYSCDECPYKSEKIHHLTQHKLRFHKQL